MPSNVVELVVRTLDEATPGLKSIGGALGALKTAAIAFGAVEAFKTLIDNSIEAETAQVRLQSALRHSAEAGSASSEELIKFAEATSESSTFSKVAVEGAETALLRFGRLTGETFQRARQDTLDLAAGMNTDLASAARIVGRALESPTQGLRTLREASIIFSPAQRALITELEKTGQVAAAQKIIFEALEGRYKGTSDVITNTLGGALKRLGNAFDEAFKIDNISFFTKAANKLADVIISIKPAAEHIADAFKEAAKAGIEFEALGAPGAESTGASVTFGPSGRRNRGATAGDFVSQATLNADRNAALLAALEKGVQPTAKLDLSLEKNKVEDLYDTWDKATETTTEKTGSAFREMQVELDQLVDHGTISAREANKRMDEAFKAALGFTSVLDENGKEMGFVFDTAAIALKKLEVPLSSTQVAIHNFTDDVQNVLGRLAIQGGLSARNFLNQFLLAVRDRAIFRAIDEIGSALTKALTPKGGGAASGTGGFVLSVIGALFGRAGGGDFSGLTVVGEEGPELVAGRGTVMNKRQLQFALGNAASTQQAVHYAPQTNIVVQGNADEKTLQYVELRLAQGQRDQRNWLAETLYRNGFPRLR